jgi:hypothetical protein
MVLGFDFDRLRSGPFEGPAIVKPPALPGDTYCLAGNIVTKLLLVIVLFFQISYVYAEIIDGPANIREKPRGKIIAVLNNGAAVEMLPPYLSNKSWYSVGLVAYIEKSAFTGNPKRLEVKGHYSLYDKQGRVIGKTIETFKIGWDIGEEKDRIGIVIEHVYTHKDNIRSDSIPEKELVNLLDAKGPGIPKSELKGFLNKYGFEKWPAVKNKDIEDYFIDESWIYDISPMPRLQLIFFKNRLVAIIHRNLLVSEKYESKELFREMKSMDITRMDADVSERIQKEIIEPLRTAD